VDGSTAAAFKAGVKSRTYQDQYPECMIENPNRPLGNLALDEFALYSNVDTCWEEEEAVAESASSTLAASFLEFVAKCRILCDLGRLL
jgi:hypothetical protein